MIYLSGCDCDENSLNPDELCPANEKCKNCKCIAKGKKQAANIVKNIGTSIIILHIRK